jgi:bifunctional DNA-binding transcriptional regulator/antitoxin component of YhaV-PrlF toxin-antitoxin module
MTKRYTIPIESNENDDLYLSLPDDLLDDLGWREGDILEWSEDIDGTLLLKRVDEESV